MSTEPLFEVADLHFRYPRGSVLAGVSFTLQPGCFYGLLGPNGCGKTTLLDLMAGLKRPDCGKIFFRGRELGTYARRELAREIALVPQNFYINFPFTVHDVVMMGRYPHLRRFARPGAEDHDLVRDALEASDTARFARQPVTALSGGERQRVIFARALAQNAGMLMLDEATSNLDIRHSLGLLRRTRERVRQGRQTVLAVFQDVNLAALYCDQLLFLKAGRLMVQGPTAHVLRADTLETVYGVGGCIRPHAAYDVPQVDFRR